MSFNLVAPPFILLKVYVEAVHISNIQNVSGFSQNTKFSSYNHFKAVRTSDFILGLWAHQAFYFTDPPFEAVDSLLSEVVDVKPEV